MKRKIYFRKRYSAHKKKILMSKDIMQFRVRISRKLKNYKSTMFRRYKRLTFLQKKFFKKFVFKSRRRTDLLFLYKKRRFYSRWVPRRYFSRVKPRKYKKKKKLFIKRMRQRFLSVNDWHTRIKTPRYGTFPKMFGNSPFRYQFVNSRLNRKKFRTWLDRRFFAKKKRYVFRLFYFFRKLEKTGFNFKTQTFPAPIKGFDSQLFFEKYRKFSLWALRYSWHRFCPSGRLRRMKQRAWFLKHRNKPWFVRDKTNPHFLYLREKFGRPKRRKLKAKRKKKESVKLSKKELKAKRKKKKALKVVNEEIKGKSKKKHRRRRNKFFRSIRTRRYKFSRRRFGRKITWRKRRQIFRFLRTVRLAYKFPHNKRFFKSRLFKKFNKFKFFKASYPNKFKKLASSTRSITFLKKRSYKLFRFSRLKSKHLFHTKKRLPRILYRNFFSKKNVPLSYYFTRKSKKLPVYFKTVRKKIYPSRFVRYNHRTRVSFRIKRILNKLRFYLAKSKRPRLSKKINKKIFFARRKYGRFLPYLGYFRRFGRKRFAYRRRRKKFFRYFKKFYSRFHPVSSALTTRSRYYRRKVSQIKLFIHVFRSVNNMFVNVSAPRGRTLYAYSAGRTHFRGSKRLSPIAIETMGKTVSLLLKNSKIIKVGLVFHTPIDYLVRALIRGLRGNVKFTHFKYHITKPHNGLRLRATRRI